LINLRWFIALVGVLMLVGTVVLLVIPKFVGRHCTSLEMYEGCTNPPDLRDPGDRARA
jgi:hypothetical protein